VDALFPMEHVFFPTSILVIYLTVIVSHLSGIVYHSLPPCGTMWWTALSYGTLVCFLVCQPLRLWTPTIVPESRPSVPWMCFKPMKPCVIHLGAAQRDERIWPQKNALENESFWKNHRRIRFQVINGHICKGISPQNMALYGTVPPF